MLKSYIDFWILDIGVAHTEAFIFFDEADEMMSTFVEEHIELFFGCGSAGECNRLIFCVIHSSRLFTELYFDAFESAPVDDCTYFVNM